MVIGRSQAVTDKRDLKMQYKNMKQPMGIYRITNKVNGRIFIGSSKTVDKVWNRISFQLQNRSYPQRELQEDYVRYGKDAIVFDVVDYLTPREEEPDYDYTDDLKTLLDIWIEKLQPYGERGYNSKLPG